MFVRFSYNLLDFLVNRIRIYYSLLNVKLVDGARVRKRKTEKKRAREIKCVCEREKERKRERYKEEERRRA